MRDNPDQIRNLDPRRCEELSAVASKAIYKLESTAASTETLVMYRKLHSETFAKCR